MNKTRLKYLFLILIILFPAVLPAVDFGLILNQYGGVGNSEFDSFTGEYRAGLIPRFSFVVGDTGSFFTSASLTAGYSTANGGYFVPELLRTEFSMSFGAFGIRAGRIGYSDPLTFIAEGLFDGVQLSHGSSLGRISLGAWYTGFLYKKNIDITMNESDQELFASDLDFGNFVDTYFAPRRMLVSLDYEHPSIGGFLQVNAAVTGQIDVSNNSEKYHSEYVTFKASMPFSNFLFQAGGSVEMIQNNSENKMALAGELGVLYFVPTSFRSLLSFNARSATGDSDKMLGAFVPVTSKSYGQIFDSKMSGITVLSLDYSARLADPIGANLTFLYFIRNGSTEFFNYSSKNPNNKLLGGEIFANLAYSIYSDLYVKLGGGAFIPKMGNYWLDLKPQWRVELSAILSIY
jgi:hypothetical protein